FSAFLETLAPEFSNYSPDVTEENIQARCRGILLMSMSNKTGKIVLTTGNKSEMAVGYATLYGDMAGGFSVLKDVTKTWVYRLAKYRNTIHFVIPQRVLDRAPSAELAPNQTDQDSLPPYNILDPIMMLYVEENMAKADIIQLGYAKSDVDKVTALIDKNEYKRRQSPPGIRISHRAFGRDWRYPITSGFGKQC
ncbi:MAG: NAD(+) synthase, partial [Proteobacteria bacterium]|nr:NAD(+) synthase [Pseudomonadota bacterium]